MRRPRTHQVSPDLAAEWLAGRKRAPGDGFTEVKRRWWAGVSYALRLGLLWGLVVVFGYWAALSYAEGRWWPWGDEAERVVVMGRVR